MQLTGPGHWGQFGDGDQAVRVLRAAVDAGVTHIDTADAYGPFVAEEYIREALYPYPSGLVIATKGGLTRHGPAKWKPCGRPEYLRQCVEMSLRRLDLECIDLYYLHRVDPAVPMADQLAVLSEMRAEGKINSIGLSKVNVDQIREARTFVDVACVQNKFSISNQTSDDVLRYCEQEKIPFVPYGPLASGKLVQDSGPLSDAAKALDITPAQLAISWALHRSPVTMPIPGTSNESHLRENLLASSVQLPAATFDSVSSMVRGLLTPPATA